MASCRPLEVLTRRLLLAYPVALLDPPSQSSATVLTARSCDAAAGNASTRPTAMAPATALTRPGRRWVSFITPLRELILRRPQPPAPRCGTCGAGRRSDSELEQEVDRGPRATRCRARFPGEDETPRWLGRASASSWQEPSGGG